MEIVLWPQSCDVTSPYVYKVLRCRLSFFAPQGRHVVPIGVKFGGIEEWCNDMGIWPAKLKFFYGDFTKKMKYKRHAGAYPLRDFHETKFALSVPRFRMQHLVKFGWICSTAYGVMRLWSWGGLVWFPKFSASHSGETMRRTPQKF